MKRLIAILTLSIPAVALHSQAVVVKHKSSVVTPTVVQTQSKVFTATSTVLSISPTNGNQLICSVAASGALTGYFITGYTLKDNNNNTFTIDKAVSISDASCNGSACGMFVGHLYSVSGVTSVTLSTTNGTAAGGGVMQCTESTGVTAYDSSSSGQYNTSSGTWTTDSVTPTSGKAALIFGQGYVYWGNTGSGNSTMAASSPYTLPTNGYLMNTDYYVAFAWIYQAVSSTSGSYTPNGTQSPNNASAGLAAVYRH